MAKLKEVDKDKTNDLEDMFETLITYNTDQSLVNTPNIDTFTISCSEIELE